MQEKDEDIETLARRVQYLRIALSEAEAQFSLSEAEAQFAGKKQDMANKDKDKAKARMVLFSLAIVWPSLGSMTRVTNLFPKYKRG